ncbi:hypothetical protein HAL_04340 [Haladaptatus sp. T7]|nr:hypothetical protein HAL_04340 [Haladaptatus sp. T7]
MRSGPCTTATDGDDAELRRFVADARLPVFVHDFRRSVVRHDEDVSVAPVADGELAYAIAIVPSPHRGGKEKTASDAE